MKPEDFSDVGNAKLFSETNKGELYFTKSLGWLSWDGKRFAQSDSEAVGRGVAFTDEMRSAALGQYCRALAEEAEAKAAAADGGIGGKSEELEAKKKAVGEAKEYLKHALITRRENRIRAFLELSKAFLSKEASAFDANPWLLATPACAIDLKDGSLKPHDPSFLCTKITLVSRSEQGTEMWDSFLDLITCEDGSLKQYLQIVAGMCAVGKVYHEGIILAVGGGRNGKSTFFNALSAVLGDYAGTIDAQLLTTERQNRGAALATLRGKRLETCGELEEGQRLSVATLKRLASTDALTIEEKFRQPETVQPSHHICLFSNFLPRVGSTDTGTWRRLTVIPFNAAMPMGSRNVPNYADRLVKEAGGAILSWIVEGAVLFYKNGCRLPYDPDVVEEATLAYKEREDWLQTFFSERCTLEPNARVGAGELYAVYRDYAAESGDYCRRMTDFNAAMELAGFMKITPRNKRTWIGLKLNSSCNTYNHYSAGVL